MGYPSTSTDLMSLQVGCWQLIGPRTLPVPGIRVSPAGSGQNARRVILHTADFEDKPSKFKQLICSFLMLFII